MQKFFNFETMSNPPPTPGWGSATKKFFKSKKFLKKNSKSYTNVKTLNIQIFFILRLCPRPLDEELPTVGGDLRRVGGDLFRLGGDLPRVGGDLP